MSVENLNYYDILEVPRDADQNLIFNAYKKAQQTFSLTNREIYQVFTVKEAKEWIDLIEEAYSIIGYPNTRRVYDQELGFSRSSSLQPAKQESSNKGLPIELPEGYGQTKLSQYPINPSIEELIAKQELFDGLFLKKIREYKKIDLTEFSRFTCIAIRHLYAIENNNFSVLPASVFVRGYIIQYCRILEIDRDRVLPSFMSLLHNEL